MKDFSKLLFIGVAFFITTVVHYTTQTDNPAVFFVHVIFRNLYLLPIVSAAYWFGLRGGAISAFVSVVLYLPHVVLQWSGSMADKVEQMGTMAVFLLVGIVAGHLSSMEKREKLRAEKAETRSQRRAIATAITTLEQALKARDNYTRQHSERTAELSVALAKELGLDETSREEVWLASQMHDIGKIGVRDDILLKPDRLTAKEWEAIKRHPIIAEEILKPIKGIEPVVSIVRAHHENFDGTGYPNGIKGDDIPLGAQILAVADTYSALTDDRLYHKQDGIDEAIEKMNKMAGKKLNPRILEEFKKMIR
jgi:HD-GYP domain-containing protein (c-di-GMP phosphodiesterase class II)